MCAESPISSTYPDGRKWEFDVFLSYNRLDHAVVERLAVALRERGLKVFKDDWYLRPGEHWPTALEEKLAASAAIVVAFGRNGLGPWQQREAVAALDRQSRDSRSGTATTPVIPVLLERESEQQAGLVFLPQNAWVEAWDPRAADLIAGAVRGKVPVELHNETNPDPRTLICPYRGLRVFREEDAGFYFGRERDLERLVAAVDLYPLVAIVGASGSGKSSLARAGLIPDLRRHASDRVWQVADMLPGSDPFLALARALLPLREPERILTWSKGDIDDECDRLKHRLRRDGAAHLSHVVGQIMREEPGTTHFLLLVDQWEELYTYRQAGNLDSPGDQAAFVQMLLEAVRGNTVRVVLTLRADYWGEVLNDEPLAARLSDNAVVHLRALDRRALEAVICRPAERAGLIIPDALVEVLINDAVGQPGDLPLLEFALEQLWFERASEPRTLTLQAYRAMGGLEKAIISRMESTHASLDRHEQEAVPGVFAALVHVGEARTDLRRRARLSELSEAGQAVARRLADKRLLVTSRDWTSGEDLLEVAHEALLRHWPKLEEWIGERRGALLTIRQLQADTLRWLDKGKDASYVWPHERVRDVVVALAQLGEEIVLSPEEREFLGPIDVPTMWDEIEHPTTTHLRRALIGERLDVLGDARPGVGLRSDGLPDINWCRVDGGDVRIEIHRDATDPNTSAEQHLSRTVESFWIARYVITIDQYRTFLEAEDGWQVAEWWSDDLHRDPDGNSYNFGRFGNHPATYISWYDAVAFCRWLTKRLGFIVRLPDEWEWQQAATGGDTRNVYPWGLGWDLALEPHRANTYQSRLGQATAVGMYPAGASQEGPLDMSGTVWEWCLNKFENPNDAESSIDARDSRAVRGGSWNYNPDCTKCAYREWFNPYYRRYYVGFRVTCFSPYKG